MTCTTCPTAAYFSAIAFSYAVDDAPADNFNNLFGDGRLPHFVHVQRQGLDDVAGVFGGGFHGGHARGMLGGGRFQHGAKNLRFDVSRKQAVQNLFLRLFVDVVDLRGGEIAPARLSAATISSTGNKFFDDEIAEP